jgi:acetyl-CoA C-acetyltransferase
MADARGTAAVLVGAAELTLREEDPVKAPDPVTVLERIARQAAADAGVGRSVWSELDTLAVVDSIGWHPKNPPRFLAERLDATPGEELLSRMGGESPLVLVNRVAERIERGESGVALVCGCHQLRTLRRARKRDLWLDWPKKGIDEAPTLIGEPRDGSSERETRYGLLAPSVVYPIFENGLRAARGLDLATHQRRVGELMSRFTEVAAGNPHAWLPVRRSAEELIAPTPENRMVAFPYTKYLNAIMDTDQAAAVLLMSVEAADALGVPRERHVYWHGGGEAAEEPWFPTERPDFASCPAMQRAADAALAGAGVGIDAIDRIDFYSCFPIAVELAAEALGLQESDPRGFTVTGGLPYAGGPGNNYTLHSLAAMLQQLRSGAGTRGLVTGNGYYLTKHSALVCSTEPRDAAPREPEPAAAGDGPAWVEEPSGAARIETYTVLHDRDGAPERGIVVGRDAEGRRFLAQTPDDRDLLEHFVAREEIGREGRVVRRDDLNRFEPA